MIRSASLLLLLVGASAAELVVRDIHAGISTLPLGFDWTIDTRNGSTSGSDSFDAGLGFEAGGRWSFARVGDPLGLVVGADFILDGWTYSGGNLAMTGMRICAGPGWAASDRWTLSATAGAQYGLSTFDMAASTSTPAFSASGSALGYDLRISADALLSRRFGLGLMAGWLVASHSLSGDHGVTITIDQSGWFAGLSAVWRFQDVPSRLE